MNNGELAFDVKGVSRSHTNALRCELKNFRKAGTFNTLDIGWGNKQLGRIGKNRNSTFVILIKVISTAISRVCNFRNSVFDFQNGLHPVFGTSEGTKIQAEVFGRTDDQHIDPLRNVHGQPRGHSQLVSMGATKTVKTEIAFAWSEEPDTCG